MSALEIIWLIAKILLASAALTAALTLLIALFHPLTLDLKLRASIKGQRAELWFVYLFRIFKIGIIATPHTQDVVVKVLFWKKRLDRQQRPRPPAPKPPAAESTSPGFSSAATTVAQPSPIVTDTIPSTEPITPSALKTGSEKNMESDADFSATVSEPAAETAQSHVQTDTRQTPPGPTTDEAETITPITRHDIPIKTAEPEEVPTPVSSPPDISSIPATHVEEPELVPQPEIRSTTPTPVDITPLKPLAEVEAGKKSSSSEKKADQPEKAAATATPSWRQKLRKFKSDLSRRYRQLQKHLRLFRQKWRLLFPVLKRFWSRGKKAFGLTNLSLMLRYALHEPYLTGMMQGSMSVFAGLANRFGINFAPIPTFAEPGVYGKGTATAIIRPWRLCFAAIGLLFEKHLWQELWIAFKWYRSQKAGNR